MISSASDATTTRAAGIAECTDKDPSGTGSPRRVVTFTHGDVKVAVVSLDVSDAGALDALTPAEREVAALAAIGWTNLAIARFRGTAVRTVANQMASILRKQGVGSRYELAERLALCPLGEGS
ncbi:MAG TPA: helix-turn-helix transcriptional regulator [Polyangiaceae bacterium]|nr:helix-turn-helix transcriptional regulator [Polyangiaceae bacterium]